MELQLHIILEMKWYGGIKFNTLNFMLSKFPLPQSLGFLSSGVWGFVSSRSRLHKKCYCLVYLISNMAQ